MHHVDPRRANILVNPATHRLKPWIFPRIETNSTVNHCTAFKAFMIEKDSYLRMMAEPKLGTPDYSVKNFLYSFPKLRKDATDADIFNFLHSVCRFCAGQAVYVPLPHLMDSRSHRGA
jgi:hypothetical protein